ncbi:hypothetical protein BD410DRAFT_712320 [Rickenella mellea]|uniref:Amino acid transporter transmembrane domain-containing protein n=1 Tax=Rickenella mellea TaxID=50990 RepID=A0A4Y7QP31_9AGAM|nr:hypothetical protein BD410DRAFT_712320 [Rickenella mellea]
MVTTFDWDDIDPSPLASTSQLSPPNHLASSVRRPSLGQAIPSSSTVRATRHSFHERTPLLRQTTSRSSLASQRPAQNGLRKYTSGEALLERAKLSQTYDVHEIPLTHKPSGESLRSEKPLVEGRSTFGQTLFNSVAILLGFGMLSEPLAFAYSGWIGGTLLIIFYGFITCYTSKILAHIILADPQIRTYADIGKKAFGPRSQLLTSFIFCMELFAVCVVLITLFGDSLHAMLPRYSATAYKLGGLIIIIPTVFLPLSVLSYSSMLGIFSTLLIIAVVIIDGLSKPDAPGSLWSPAETRLGISSLGNFGVAFGLFMAGFSGHAVLPSLAKDMAKPEEFDTMINWAFVAATVIYSIIGSFGYLMFGDYVSDEVSQDLLTTPGYNAFLNRLCGWSLVILPVTKFALTARPVNITFEAMLGIDTRPPPTSPEEDVRTVTSPASGSGKAVRRLKSGLMIIERTAFTLASVSVSILFPEFGSMMAFLGSFSAFLLCVIGPVSAKIALAGRCSTWDGLLLSVAIVMAVWGTVAAFAA